MGTEIAIEHILSELHQLQQENDELRAQLSTAKAKYEVLLEKYQQLRAEKDELAKILQEKTQFIIQDQQERNAAEYAEAIRRAQFAKRGPKTNVSLHKDIAFYRNQGMSIRKIAKELDCSTSTVQRVLKECSDN